MAKGYINEVVMQSKIALLLQIQEKDIAMRSLEKERKLAPEALEATKKRVEETENAAKEKKEISKKLQVERKDLEIDVESKSENIKKYQLQLFQVKTNEEYKALEKEINGLKFAIGLQEDKILEKMEEIERSQKDVKKLEEELSKVKENLKKEEKEVASKLELIASQISQIQKNKESLILKVPEDLLGRYNRIFNNKPDTAMVPVLNNACQGCHMRLPPNVVNEVKKSNELIICDNCARILYWPSG